MRKYFPQGVLWCKKPEREHGARQPLPLTAAVFFACAAMPRNRAKRDAKNSRSAERGCSSVLPPPNRRRMVGARNPALPPAGYAAQSRKARCKNSRSAERGCSSVFTPPNRRRMVGARNPAPPLAGYAAQSREARCKKQPERRARLFLCPHAAEQAANGWSQ